MGIFDGNMPYTNLHELNLDWVIKEVKNVKNKTDEIDTAVEQTTENANIAQEKALESENNANRAEHYADIAQEKAAEISIDYQELQENVLTNTNDISTLSSRMDSFTNLEEGSTTGDAELIDGRIGWNGETYTNIGTAIRTQISQLEKMFGEFEKLKQIYPTFTPGFINPLTLQIQTTTPGPHLISDVITIPAKSMLYVPTISKSTNTCLVAETDANGNPIQLIIRGPSAGNSDGRIIAVPFLEETYVRVGGNTSMSAYMNYYISSLTEYKCTNDNVKEKYSPLTLDYGVGPITPNGVVSTGDGYLHSAMIFLPKGAILDLYSCGSSNNVTLSEWVDTGQWVRDIIFGSGKIQHVRYKSDKNQRVRISCRVNPQNLMGAVLPEEIWKSWSIYYEELEYENKTALTGKKMTLMGDSLFAGNNIGKGAVWCEKLATKYNMEVTNLAINGNTVARQEIETANDAMVDRIDTLDPDTNYFVLIGGANDKRLNVPLGDEDSTDLSTFYGAVNSIISQVRTIAPKCKILLMSTYNRFTSRNSLGLKDWDYAQAMLKAGYNNGVRTFDNYHDSGVDFTIPVLDEWLDESNDVMQLVDGQVVHHTATHHFGIEGYDWLEPIYEQILLGL